VELDARGRRLRAALAAVLVRDNAPELRLMREWLDSWSGLGLVVAGMTYQGWDLQITAYAARDWRANFFPVGIAHSMSRQRRGSRRRGAPRLAAEPRQPSWPAPLQPGYRSSPPPGWPWQPGSSLGAVRSFALGSGQIMCSRHTWHRRSFGRSSRASGDSRGIPR